MYVRNKPQAKIFALYIAHFADFVLKICINLGKNSLISCKTLNKQRFLAKLQIVVTGQFCKPVTLLANSVHYLP